MLVPLLTSYWRQLLNYAKTGDQPHFVPVNVAVGAPRKPDWAKKVYRVKEITPYGLLKLEGEAFDEAYQTRVAKAGPEIIQDRFEAIYRRYEMPLVLLCWEPPGQHCHRRTFADWWYGATGQHIPEANGLDLLSITKALQEIQNG